MSLSCFGAREERAESRLVHPEPEHRYGTFGDLFDLVEFLLRFRPQDVSLRPLESAMPDACCPGFLPMLIGENQPPRCELSRYEMNIIISQQAAKN